MTPYFRRFLAFPILYIVLAASLFARAQSEDIIPNDSAVLTGTLENGFTYYVRANDNPSGRAQLRLVVKAGSVLEDEDQRGLAHFVEHMLFNGTERFPGRKLVETLESFGMEFGPEINAYTSFDQTVYQLDVSTEEQEEFLLGLDVLEEWAFHALFDAEEVEKERGVIHEEWRMSRSGETRLQDEAYPVLFWGSRYAERKPIGDMEIVANAPPETLRRFYNDWYRPNLMAVIAVGDFNPEETVRLITERFGNHANPDNPRPRQEYLIPNHEETFVKILHDSEVSSTRVQLLVKYNPHKARFLPELKKELSENLFHQMLNARLAELSRNEDPPFLYGYGFSTSYTSQTSLAGLSAAVSEDGVLRGLEAILTEAERVQRFGFSESELERAKQELTGAFENYWNQRNDSESSSYVATMMDAYLKDETFPSIDWQWQAVQDLLPEITLKDVQAEAATLLSESNRVVLVKGPSVPAVTEITETDVRDVLDRTKTAELIPWEDHSVSGPLVPFTPTPGKIISRSQIAGTDIHTWALSNGSVVLLKTTDFTKDEVLFRALSPGGTSLVDDGDFISAQYAADAVSQSGLGDYSLVDLQKILAGKQLELEPFISDSYEGLSGSSSRKDLESLMQLIYLHHFQPRRDRVAWNALMERTAESLRNRESSPTTLYNDLIWKTLYDNHLRIQPMKLEDLDEADPDKALDIYRERFADAGDFTYIFVGDITAEELEPLVKSWIATLPSSIDGSSLPASSPTSRAGFAMEDVAQFTGAGFGSAETWQDRGLRNVDGVQKTVTFAGSEPLSMVTQVWMGDWDGSFQERYRLQSLAAALEMMFTNTIREESGGTYSVGVFAHLSSIPNTDYRFIVQYSCDPERVNELTNRVVELVDEWRQSPPEAKYAEDVSASQKRSFAANLERNNWWIGQIAFAVVTGQNFQDMMNRPALYDTLSPEVLSETARRYLDDSHYLDVVLYPEQESEE